MLHDILFQVNFVWSFFSYFCFVILREKYEITHKRCNLYKLTNEDAVKFTYTCFYLDNYRDFFSTREAYWNLVDRLIS